MNKTNLSKVQQETFDPAILNDIEGYWNERSKTFSETRKKEMSGPGGAAWLKLLSEHLPTGRTLNVLDIGTGAGFPGMPLKISMPELKVTLMDSLQKRLGFLKEVCDALSLEGVDMVHARAEDGGKDKKYRERFDIVTARAVAALPVLAEYCLPFVKVGGVFLAMKGHAEDEIKSASKAIALLGGTIEKTDTFRLPGTDMDRTIVVVRKIRPTPARFPRKAGLPSKEPLS